MTTKKKQIAQNPLILRSHRLMEAFAKSDDERDFYLDRIEGFIIYVDLDKTEEELKALEVELTKNIDRYFAIPKLTFFETKKIMEGFVNEKVYDIDIKEKLNDIIHSKEARENFLEFLYDHHSELEKWQLYYQERSRIRIIEWLRLNHFRFVFEEDLDLSKNLIEKLKRYLFSNKVPKDIADTRKTLESKAKTYYSSEALNPRPKRGRPPKQAAKVETEVTTSVDIYTTPSPSLRPFLFIPDITSPSAVTFSSKFESEKELIAGRKTNAFKEGDISLESLQKKLAELRILSTRWKDSKIPQIPREIPEIQKKSDDFFTKKEESVKRKKKSAEIKQPISVKPVSKAIKTKPKTVKRRISQPKESTTKKNETKNLKSIRGIPKPVTKKTSSSKAAKKTRPAKKIAAKKNLRRTKKKLVLTKKKAS